jgi:hypothetical protein
MSSVDFERFMIFYETYLEGKKLEQKERENDNNNNNNIDYLEEEIEEEKQLQTKKIERKEPKSLQTQCTTFLLCGIQKGIITIEKLQIYQKNEAKQQVYYSMIGSMLLSWLKMKNKRCVEILRDKFRWANNKHTYMMHVYDYQSNDRRLRYMAHKLRKIDANFIACMFYVDRDAFWKLHDIKPSIRMQSMSTEEQAEDLIRIITNRASLFKKESLMTEDEKRELEIQEYRRSNRALDKRLEEMESRRIDIIKALKLHNCNDEEELEMIKQGYVFDSRMEKWILKEHQQVLDDFCESIDDDQKPKTKEELLQAYHYLLDNGVIYANKEDRIDYKDRKQEELVSEEEYHAIERKRAELKKKEEEEKKKKKLEEIRKQRELEKNSKKSVANNKNKKTKNARK